jgi:hypothetical protein
MSKTCVFFSPYLRVLKLQAKPHLFRFTTHHHQRFLGIVDYMCARKAYPPATVSLALFRSILQSQFMWTWLAPLGGVPESQLALIGREPQVIGKPQPGQKVALAIDHIAPPSDLEYMHS